MNGTPSMTSTAHLLPPLARKCACPRKEGLPGRRPALRVTLELALAIRSLSSAFPSSMVALTYRCHYCRTTVPLTLADCNLL